MSFEVHLSSHFSVIWLVCKSLRVLSSYLPNFISCCLLTCDYDTSSRVSGLVLPSQYSFLVDFFLSVFFFMFISFLFPFSKLLFPAVTVTIFVVIYFRLPIFFSSVQKIKWMMERIFVFKSFFPHVQLRPYYSSNKLVVLLELFCIHLYTGNMTVSFNPLKQGQVGQKVRRADRRTNALQTNRQTKQRTQPVIEVLCRT